MGLFSKKSKNACHVCGYGYEDGSANCSSCGTNVQDSRVETCLAESYGNWIQGKMQLIAGNLFVTNLRVFFIPTDDTLLRGKALGIRFAIKDGGVELGTAAISLPYSEIASVEEGRSAMLKVLILKTKEGEEYKLQPQKIKDCKKQIDAQMA